MKEFIPTSRNTLVTNRRKIESALVGVATLLLVNACSSGEQGPVASETPTAAAATEGTLLLCPPNVFTLDDGETIDSVAEEYFSSRPVDEMTVVNLEGTPIADAQTGETIRFIDPECS